MLVTYSPDATMREARARYFDVNGFGPNGGYDQAWVNFELGPLPMPFPNTAGRIRAVKYHDLHHVLTGYDTDTIGEFEISAWEIGAGCKDFAAAWFLNLGGTASGLVTAPRRTFTAFVRGRRSRSLYGEAFEPLLDETVGALRARHVGEATDASTGADKSAFAAACIAGAIVGSVMVALALPLVPVGLVTRWLRASKTVNA
ncbi:hypothetical protein AKJ09_07198 [Labilithrix luteola]|uniref:Ubiquinone biosynthesis protein n=1 Tax=Labilithrix luteola TaxID=1391654 RepID=A0A0K1Q548_9BACT|nr:hypothetical protein [Labilithrix luteola]AKV00535.1 hypothetical protein AKJ09_07198 [Labilithrix luteola]